MICFRAERFTWRRIWQNPGELLLPGIADMATRALLYRRPYEPSRLLIKPRSQIFAVRLRRHRRARRYTLRIHPSDREAILTIPPRGTIADAKDFAQRHGGWIAARLGRLPKAAPFLPGTVLPLRGVPHRIVHRPGVRGTVWPETRDSGERILCVAGAPEHIERRVHEYMKREVRADLQVAVQSCAEALGVKVKRLSIRDQSSRWGSCTSAGSLSFLWRGILGAPLVLGFFAAPVEGRRPVLRSCRARQELARHQRQRPASLRHPGLTCGIQGDGRRNRFLDPVQPSARAASTVNPVMVAELSRPPDWKLE